MKLIRLLVTIFLVCLCSNWAVETGAVPLDAAQEQFFSQFRTSINGENTRQLIQLTHPKSSACTRADDQERYYEMVLKGLVQMLGRQQTIKEIESKKVDAQSLKQGTDAAAQSSMRWPITPEEQLVIKYEKEGSESSATLYIAREQDQWKWVHLCYE